MELAGAIALVTGASSGIGASTARALAAAGARVALVARRRDHLDALATELPAGTAVPFVCDVRDPRAIVTTVAAVQDRIGGVDVLVNNAGIGRYLAFLESGPEDVAAIFETNLHAALHFTRAVLPGMLARRRGHLVNVASIAARIGSRNHSIYCASKFALAGFSESLGLELEGSGVGVTLVNPGIVATAFFDEVRSTSTFVNGAERVVDAILELYPEAVLATSVISPEYRRHHEGRQIVTSYLQRLPGLFRRLMLRFA
jgi:short-subunit dehydrogenase